MAAFFVHVCRFGGCGLTFPSLGDLILHIEDQHIESDPLTLEKQELQQPSSLALSYIHRFITDAARREQLENLKRKPSQRALSPVAAIRSITPTGSEFDDDDMSSESSDSDNSWTTSDDFTSELILNSMTPSSNEEKPFACPIPGCKKRYKNVNGIKYHAKNGHRNDGKIRKAYRCHCGKSYKTTQGLKNHTLSQHPPISRQLPGATQVGHALMPMLQHPELAN
ncbi:PREDICTED: juxtaposed with another zinc finger protein 1-like [Branchiostoma belcheri]|uniref:Juxtaposed with another zinc finger protein 1-like n=1 Tax=Branchiostoma belcheri TaxID=7741 RepID=A0A6P4Y2C0_BRABE|nr:PREDICTED: juxtaposed with another zinc finger protein 1-like [Branchiostoma belcheri]